jgi:hypothetical protein
MEEEENNCKLKVGINVAMVEWDHSVVDVCNHARLEGKYVSRGTSRERSQSYKRLTNQMGNRKEGSFGCNQGITKKIKSLKIDPLK